MDSSLRRFRLSHTPELDGLRGIAILVVVFNHFFYVGMGALGVDLFFVLSGFLITILLWDERERTGTIKLSYFYMRRVLRLFPALGLVVLGLYVGELLGLTTFPRETLIYIATYTTNFAIVARKISTSHHDNPLAPTWSLAMEEQFYILWPLIFIGLCRMSRGRLPTRALLIIFLIWEMYRWWFVVTTTSAYRIYYGTDTHAHLLLIGCLLGFIRLELPVSPSVTKLTALLWNLFALALAGMVLFGPTDFNLYNMVNTLWGLAFAALIWATTLPLPGLRRVLRWNCLQLIGKISYGLYLYHVPVMAACREVTGERWIGSLVALPLSILAAWLSFRFVEAPILKLKKHFKA